jgi:hypothetical protein
MPVVAAFAALSSLVLRVLAALALSVYRDFRVLGMAVLGDLAADGASRLADIRAVPCGTGSRILVAAAYLASLLGLIPICHNHSPMVSVFTADPQSWAHGLMVEQAQRLQGSQRSVWMAAKDRVGFLRYCLQGSG